MTMLNALTVPNAPNRRLSTWSPAWRFSLILLSSLFLLLSSCATSAIDKARTQYSNALKVTTATQGRYKTQELDYLLALAKSSKTKQDALRAYEAYKIRRQSVEIEVTRCQSIMDEARDLLLLDNDERGIQAAKNATDCATSLRDKVAKLFDGG